MNPEAVSPTGAIGAAIAWVVNLLVGSLATSLAIIAVVGFGLTLFAGRLEKRRAAQLILGCFIVFGAATIAGGLIDALTGPTSNAPPPTPVPVVAADPPAPPAQIEPYDPYAGAALPPKR